MPHIHAEYQEEVAVFAIEDGGILDGSLPTPKQKLVEAWIDIEMSWRIHNGGYFVEWDNEADLSADTLYLGGKSIQH